MYQFTKEQLTILFDALGKLPGAQSFQAMAIIHNAVNSQSKPVDVHNSVNSQTKPVEETDKES